MRSTLQPRIFFFLAVITAVAVYWAGLTGPFIFDDTENLAAIEGWLTGRNTWQYAVFGEQSLFLARPLAMASFLLNASVGGMDTFYFKLGNLVVHLICGWLIWKVMRTVLAEDPRLGANADLAATVIAALWLLHPLHASTVLYAIQRMAQLSTLFVLACVWVYLVARRQLAAGQIKPAVLKLFLLFPLLMTAGMLSKQNAAVAPALCLVFEVAYFIKQPRPHYALQIFFGLFLALPALALVALLAVQPERILIGYADYDFGLAERLMSQSRALVDYLGQLLFPRGPLMGLYTDDFVKSTSLLSPPSTLLSLLALVTISGAAIAMYRRAPSIFSGWFFFLVAHSIESSFLPLDLYFEHRNYLPSAGLLLSAVGLCGLLGRNVPAHVFTSQRLAVLTAVGLAVVFAFGTLGRASVWQDRQSLVDQGYRQHPGSLRASLDKASVAQHAGNFDEYESVMAKLTRSEDPKHRVLGHLYRISLACIRGIGGDPTDLAQAVANAGTYTTLNDVLAYRALASNSARKGCGAVTDDTIADSIARTVDKAVEQPDGMQPKWLLRNIAAQLYARNGDWKQALVQSKRAWQPASDIGLGIFLSQAYIQNRKYDSAESVLREVSQRIRCHDTATRNYYIQTWISLEHSRNPASMGRPISLPAYPCSQ